MEKEYNDREKFVGKKVIDASGDTIGVCIEIDMDSEEPHLIVEVNTKTDGKVKSKVPASTIQAVGEMVVLNVEIEGLFKDKKVVTIDENDETAVTQDGLKTKEPKTEGEESSGNDHEEMDKEDQDTDHGSWVLYRSIKSKSHD